MTWKEKINALVEDYPESVRSAIAIGISYGNIDGDHHKMWVIDQMLRTLVGDKYDALIAAHNDGEDGPDTYGWDTGIAP